MDPYRIARRIHGEAILRNCTMVEALNAMLADSTAEFVFEPRFNGKGKSTEVVRLAFYYRYAVEVGTASHDDLQEGDTETETVKVVTMAENDTEAVLIATQMAACNKRGAMPTRALLLEFPTD